MPALERVTAVEPLGGRVLRITFTDGLVRELDFAGALPGILALIDSDNVFSAADVDHVAGTVSWSAGVDLDPDVLHGDAEPASLTAPKLLSEYRLQRTR